MDIDDYRKEFIEEVKSTAEASQDFEASAFVEVASRLLADYGEIADFESCHFRGTGSRNRALAVDGYAFDDADGSVRVLAADWDGGENAVTLTQTDAKAQMGRARAFVEESLSAPWYENLENSTEAFGFSKELHRYGQELTRCRVFLVTDKMLSGRARDFPETRIGSMPVEFHVWDIARFHRVAESQSGRDEVLVDFDSLIPGGIPALAAGVGKAEYRAFLCNIRGDVLARTFDEFGSRLLEGNVRSFLSAKGKINKSIRSTIRNQPEMFFAYNNGIAATASEVQLTEERGALLHITRARDLQIVNGGQTTASLAQALREGGADLQKIYVPMKLSVIPGERAGEIIPWIARYANSQNKVSDADFFSNHDFHRRLETLSRQIWAPAVGGAQHETHWFYERTRGQFANEQAKLTPRERKRFLLQNPKNQLMTKTDVAKFENAWRRLPHTVCLGSQKNFLAFAEVVQTEWEKSEVDFNRDYFTRLVAKAMLFGETERLVSAQPWYQGGFRAQIVAYTVSKLAHLIATETTQHDLDFAAIWTAQRISPALSAELTCIAGHVAEVITNPDPGYANPTEWCKREQCWKRVAALPLKLSAALRKELTSKDDVRVQRKEAKQVQREDNHINRVVQVVNLGTAFWGLLREWGVNENLWNEEEKALLLLACRKTFVPHDKQASRLLALRDKAVEEGFAAPS